MFDDLRVKGSAFDDDETGQEISAAPAPSKKSRRRRKPQSTEVLLLGMTAAQRFVVAIMLFLDVTVLGFFLLLATQSVVLPI